MLSVAYIWFERGTGRQFKIPTRWGSQGQINLIGTYSLQSEEEQLEVRQLEGTCTQTQVVAYVQSNASKNKKALPPGFDVRGDGGYIMLPPSRNRAGFYHRTQERRPLRASDVPELVTVDGQEYRLREALGLTPPAPGPEREVRPSFIPFSADDDDRCPMYVMLDRAADYASDSRNKGAFMLGLWANANGYRLDEALHAAHEYTDMVQGVKRTPFTIEEAQKAIRSAYTYPRNEPWKRKEELE